MNWKTTLQNISQMINSSLDEQMIYYDKSRIRNNWLGYQGAQTNSITRKEKKLGIELPESYTKFIETSNGFKQISAFNSQLLPIEEIDWLRNTDSDFLSIFDEKDDASIDEKDYYQYNENQQSTIFKVNHLKNTIKLSKWTDGSIILLNPKVTFNGEYEAWIYADWYPGVKRFKSFEDLIVSELHSTQELVNVI